MAALSISNVADVEFALSAPLNSFERIYCANLDMKGFHEEVVRVVLLDAQHRCITKVDISRGTVNESPRSSSGDFPPCNHPFGFRLRIGTQPPLKKMLGLTSVNYTETNHTLAVVDSTLGVTGKAFNDSLG